MSLDLKRNNLIEAIKTIKDERVLNQIIIASKKDLIESLIMDYLTSGADGNRVMYPEKVKDNLFSIILNSNVDFMTVKNFLDKVNKGAFDDIIRKTLFGNGETPFHVIKNCDPFITKTFKKLIDLTDGVGTVGAVAGKAEFLFIMLGADKGDIGDVLFEGEMAEVKGAGAKIVFSRQKTSANGVGWNDNPARVVKETANQLFNRKMTFETGSPLSPADVANFFNLDKNPDTTVYNLENFIKLHEAFLPKIFPSAGQSFIDKAIAEMKRRFTTTLDTGVYADILVKMGFEQYLHYGKSKKLRSVLYFSEKDSKFISVENVATNAFVNSGYFTVSSGYLGARDGLSDAGKFKIINLATREIQSRRKLMMQSKIDTNIEKAKTKNSPLQIPRSKTNYVVTSKQSSFKSPIPYIEGESNKMYHFLRVLSAQQGHYGIVHNTIQEKSTSQKEWERVRYHNIWKQMSALVKNGSTEEEAAVEIFKKLAADTKYNIPFATKNYFRSL